MTPLPVVLALFALLPTATAKTADSTLPPETARLDSILEGRGVQVYSCERAPDGHFAWKLTGPDADLFNLATGKRVGRHTEGPAWQIEGGPTLQGSVLQSKPSVSPGDVPWLLLRVSPQASTPAPGGTNTGEITLVRRYNTHGGVAPSVGCDAAHPGVTARVPYSATYGFYRGTP